MNEHEFLSKLKQRAEEQQQMMQKMPTPAAFYTLVFWLGEHPWRILIPVAVLLTVFFRVLLGKQYYEGILWIFGGL
ncbi:MAG TPA: hypothetical protein VJC10_01810 [Patescibacteria group bacterium]|nr:hypothetical protein [Patescibacteria group bacterium]